MNHTFLDNHLVAWGIALAIAVGAMLAMVLAKKLALRFFGTLAARTNAELDDCCGQVISDTTIGSGDAIFRS
ncbi:hypothetical protein RBA41_01825 [Massilia sp. CCM 9210]|uniref:hypothetical protein n=1 Tax=Massilia scottii TaxID=3057166 RepID=UPI002796CEE3|nr:hypothetical protein [Massilia sp. CCM 9210]MDQ1812034.1 hypothetical protein [Massilia sp. CCM 9210]